MKVETKRVYNFEEGDVIVNTEFYWAAIRFCRYPGEGIWKHTNGHDSDIDVEFDDTYAEKVLTRGTWEFFGTHKPSRGANAAR